MKKFYLVILLALFLNILAAQQPSVMPSQLRNLAVRVEYIRPGENPGTICPVFLEQGITAAAIVPEETQIGNTIYDLQTNTLLSSRFHMFADGTMGAVWTFGLEASAFADRGTGYNYYDGESWGAMPTDRIESLRTGWPSYAAWGPGGEIVVSHDFAAHVLYFNSREIKGTGNWTQSAFSYSSGPPALSWPRMITAGEDNMTIHLLANSYEAYNGQVTALVYSRSLDGGSTWTDQNVLLDGMDVAYYNEISADAYVWAEPMGNTVAFLCASAFHDMFMMKSEDNGETWEKTVIWEHPYPFWDWEATVADTFFCVDNSASIALDASGKAHVTFGINRVLHVELGTTYYLFPYVDGIGYWNEDMPAFTNDLDALAPPQYGYPNSELVENVNYIGWTQDVDDDGVITFIADPFYYREFGISTMPSVYVEDDGTIYVVFSSTTETYDNFEYNYKHLWARAYQNGVWGPFADITSDIMHIFDECIYPVIGGTSTDGLHLIYNADATPGIATDGNHDYIDNRIIHAMVPKSDLLTGVTDPADKIEDIGLVLSPNPAADKVKCGFFLAVPSRVDAEVLDFEGRTIFSRTAAEQPAGYRQLNLDVSGLTPGIYLVSVTTGKGNSTKKLLISR